MINFTKLLVVSLILVGLGSCEDTPIEKAPAALEENDNYQPNSDQVDAEKYMQIIDNDSLFTGKSLYYSKENGESVEVDIFVNDSNVVVKMVEEYTVLGSNSICTNVFYYKDNHKFVSKELFEEVDGDVYSFVERVTYYKEGVAAVTKERKANFENELVDKVFMIVGTHDCSDKRAFEAMNQKNEFATTFQGFVESEQLIYLIVGEDKKDGFSTTLIVQFITPVINELRANESKMIGTPLRVNFETIKEHGFESQALMSVQIIE